MIERTWQSHIEAALLKFKAGKTRVPQAFAAGYPNSTMEYIDRQNYGAFVGITEE